MYHKLKDLQKNHQLVVSFFIGVAIVAVWRGVWGFLDLYFFPNDLVASYSISTLIGIIILGATHNKFS